MIELALGAGTLILIGLGLKQKKAKPIAWSATASNLHMSFEPGPHSFRKGKPESIFSEAHGVRNGFYIYCGHAAEGRTYLSLVFPVALKRRFDQHWKSNPRQKSIFVAPVNHELLRNVDMAWTLPLSELETTDEKIVAQMNGLVFYSSELENVIVGLVKMAEQVLENWRTGRPIPMENVSNASWTQAAQELGADYFARGLRMTKKSQNFGMLAELDEREGQFHTFVTAYFLSPLRADLKIKQAGFSTVFQQDVAVGHQTFDDQYVLQGNDEERLREIFTEESIEALMKLNETYSVAVSDFGVQASTPRSILETETLVEVFELVERSATEMVAHRYAQSNRGPYR